MDFNNISITLQAPSSASLGVWAVEAAVALAVLGALAVVVRRMGRGRKWQSAVWGIFGIAAIVAASREFWEDRQYANIVGSHFNIALGHVLEAISTGAQLTVGATLVALAFTRPAPASVEAF